MYPDASGREVGLVIRRTTDSPPLPTTLETRFIHGGPSGPSQREYAPAFPCVSNTGSGHEVQFGLSTSERRFPRSIPSSSSLEAVLNDIPQPILESLLPQIWEPRILNTRKVSTIIDELCAFVPSMAYNGHTLYLHGSLYKNWQPQTYLDSCSLSALYMAKTQRNVPMLINSINAKVLGMLENSHSWTLAEHLSAVQAMIIYQTIRMFDPELGQQEIGQKQNALLELWTATLWKRSFNEPIPPHISSLREGMTYAQSQYRNLYDHHAWIFQESLRRTVLMSVFLRGAWCCANQGGWCEQIPVLARLPLSKDVRLWEAVEEEWNGMMNDGSRREEGKGLIAYGDLSYGWEPRVANVEELSDFERLLLVACKGNADDRLFV